MGAAEVPKNRGALMQVVLAPQLLLRGEKCVAPAGIDHVTRADGVAAAIIGAHFQMRFVRAVLGHRHYLVALACVRAARSRVVVEHLVEILAPYLVCVGRAVADGAGKRVGVVAAFIIGLEIGTGFEYAELPHLVQHAQALEHGKIHRQQGFADMKTRVMRLLERDHRVTAPGQQGRRGAAGGTAADHHHIASFGHSMTPATRGATEPPSPHTGNFPVDEIHQGQRYQRGCTPECSPAYRSAITVPRGVAPRSGRQSRRRARRIPVAARR